jgi:predicted ABC-type transport system involved in lysophospholipase L1 biosynthesis ATPase subunit
VSELLVRAERLSRSYGEGDRTVVALLDASFDVVEGDRIALAGPSGSGKSTVLHLIAGLDEPSSGRIEWPGIGARRVLRPGPVALAFQGPSLLPPLDVAENVALPILLAGGSEDDARRRALEMIERLELSDVASRLPEELSGGQMQRAGLARALAGRPRLLLADEPTGQQDRDGGARVMETLFACMDDIPGSAVLVATHDARVAARMEKRWELEGGRLLAPAMRR